MENLFFEIVKTSPILGLMLIFWFYQRKDYKEFIDKVQSQNHEREKSYQETINNLSSNLNKIEIIETDVKEIKECILKL